MHAWETIHGRVSSYLVEKCLHTTALFTPVYRRSRCNSKIVCFVVRHVPQLAEMKLIDANKISVKHGLYLPYKVCTKSLRYKYLKISECGVPLCFVLSLIQSQNLDERAVCLAVIVTSRQLKASAFFCFRISFPAFGASKQFIVIVTVIGSPSATVSSIIGQARFVIAYSKVKFDSCQIFSRTMISV